MSCSMEKRESFPCHRDKLDVTKNQIYEKWASWGHCKALQGIWRVHETDGKYQASCNAGYLLCWLIDFIFFFNDLMAFSPGRDMAGLRETLEGKRGIWGASGLYHKSLEVDSRAVRVCRCNRADRPTHSHLVFRLHIQSISFLTLDHVDSPSLTPPLARGIVSVKCVPMFLIAACHLMSVAGATSETGEGMMLQMNNKEWKAQPKMT